MGRVRDGSDGTEEHLDQSMATQAWFDLSLNATLTNRIAGRSDHSPISVQLVERVRSMVKKKFKLKKMCGCTTPKKGKDGAYFGLL